MLTFRTGTPADIPAIVALERQSEAAAHWNDQNYASLFTADGPRRLVLITESEGAAVAFVVARVVGSEWDVENIVVAAQMRRQGIASEFIRRIVEQAEADGAQKIVLEVRESNLPARALYEKAGFVESGSRSGYYRDPEENAICYGLELRPSQQGMKRNV